MRYKAPSELVKCDICGKEVYARGIGSHLRLAHQLKVTTVTQVKEVTKVIPERTQVKGSPKSMSSGGQIAVKETKVIETEKSYESFYADPTIEDYLCPGCGTRLRSGDPKGNRGTRQVLADPGRSYGTGYAVCASCLEEYYRDPLAKKWQELALQAKIDRRSGKALFNGKKDENIIHPNGWKQCYPAHVER